MTRGEVRAQLRALGWRSLGRHRVVLHHGPVTSEAGPRGFVDGESVLVLAGLRHFPVSRIRVSVPRGARIRQRGASSGIDIRQTRRREPADLVTGSGVPRSRPAVAAVRPESGRAPLGRPS